jgi:hypothetical protein
MPYPFDYVEGHYVVYVPDEFGRLCPVTEDDLPF